MALCMHRYNIMCHLNDLGRSDRLLFDETYAEVMDGKQMRDGGMYREKDYCSGFAAAGEVH
jgi:hypothetical protein